MIPRSIRREDGAKPADFRGGQDARDDATASLLELGEALAKPFG